MISKTVVVNLPADAEARPVAVLVQIASKYESKITINSQNRRINAKSIMGMMSLGFGNGKRRLPCMAVVLFIRGKRFFF